MVEMIGQTRTLILVGLLTGLFYSDAVAAADYKDNYRQGIKAIEAGRWAEAVRELRNAIAQKSEEKVGFSRYLPYFYLGKALAQLTDCRGALEAWKTSEAQGEIKKLPEYTELKAGLKTCEGQLDKATAAAQAATQELAVARQAKTSVASATASLTSHGDAQARAFAEREQAAQELLDQAEGLLREGEAKTDLEKLARAKSLASQVAQDLNQLAGELKARLNDAKEATVSAQGELLGLVGVVRGLLDSIADLAPYPPQLQQQVSAVSALLEAAAAAQQHGTSTELVALRDRLNEAMTQLQQAVERPPRSLQEAATAFLRGDYPTVLTLLQDKRYREARARGHACLFRAAARYALFVLGGERDASLELQLQDDLAICAKIEPRPEPNSQFFSPRFMEFYRQKLATGAATSTSTSDGA